LIALGAAFFSGFARIDPLTGLQELTLLQGFARFNPSAGVCSKERIVVIVNLSNGES
jgi:hypothetical protein